MSNFKIQGWPKLPLSPLSDAHCHVSVNFGTLTKPRLLSFTVTLGDTLRFSTKRGQQSSEQQRLQNCFWDLDSKRKVMMERKASEEDLKNNLEQSRRGVVSVFREVGFAVIAFRKKGECSLNRRKTVVLRTSDTHLD